jgi:hypothetical protein
MEAESESSEIMEMAKKANQLEVAEAWWSQLHSKQQCCWQADLVQ